MTLKFSARASLLSYVYQQLPRQVRDRVEIRAQADAYLLQAHITFTDSKGATYECDLEEGEVEGVMLNCRIPDAMLTYLCLVVR